MNVFFLMIHAKVANFPIKKIIKFYIKVLLQEFYAYSSITTKMKSQQ
jgi:hypothetical protein